MLARVLGGLLGAWLFASAFLWPHDGAQFHNAWVVGALVIGFTTAALAGHERGRSAATALAIWLFLSNLVFPTTLMTAWNHALIAVGMFFLSLIPTVQVGRRARPVAV